MFTRKGIAAGRPRANLSRLVKRHMSRVHGLAFSPEGKRLASGSPDGTVRIWDATPLDDTPQPAAGEAKK